MNDPCAGSRASTVTGSAHSPGPVARASSLLVPRAKRDPGLLASSSLQKCWSAGPNRVQSSGGFVDGMGGRISGQTSSELAALPGRFGPCSGAAGLASGLVGRSFSGALGFLGIRPASMAIFIAPTSAPAAPNPGRSIPEMLIPVPGRPGPITNFLVHESSAEKIPAFAFRAGHARRDLRPVRRLQPARRPAGDHAGHADGSSSCPSSSSC